MRAALQFERHALWAYRMRRGAGVHQKHGDDSVYELDALTPAQLASLLQEAILAVIDVDAYGSELAQEERDLEAIAKLKRQILK